MEFAYDALSNDGSTRSQTIEAGSIPEAAELLRRQGLLVMSIRPHEQRTVRSRNFTALLRRRSTSGPQSLVLFARAMKMLLESGAPLVVALEAVEKQIDDDVFRKVITQLREAVEQGASLSEAMDSTSVFSPTVRSMISAGEVTASLPTAFSRLSELLEDQFRTRKLIVGSLTYPAILTIMICLVMVVILTFVVPRFKTMFEALRAPVPLSTQIMLEVSEWIMAHGIVLGVVTAGVTASIVAALRQRSVRHFIAAAVLRIPFVGPLCNRLVLARLLRVWSAMLNSHVPLLEAIQQSAEAVRGTAFAKLTQDVEEALSTGRRMGSVLSASPFVPPIVASAIATAEENARLAEAVTFVSRWLDEDNSRSIQQLTHVAEPLLLAVMGLVVGGIAMSLFLPLFDMASAVH